jgi:hypothetical protein
VLLVGVARLLLAGDRVPLERAGKGHEAAAATEAVAQFGPRGLGLGPYQLAQPCVGSSIELAGRHARVRFGLYRAGAPLALQESDDAGPADRKEAGDLAARQVAALAGSDDAFSKIVGVGSHGCTAAPMCPPGIRFRMRHQCEPL